MSLHTISFDKPDCLPEEKDPKEVSSFGKVELSNANHLSNASPRAHTNGNRNIPPPPSLPDFSGSSDGISDIQKSLQSLYEYNVMLREKLVTTQSTLDALTADSSHSESRHD